MAKLSATLGDVNSPYSPIAPVTDSGTGTAIAGLAKLAGVGANIYQGVQERQERADQAAGIRSAHETMLELEDKQALGQLELNEIQGEVKSLYQDGITPEEQLRLDELNRESNRLSGLEKKVKDPNSIRLRANAAQKRALADPRNSNIIPEIAAIYNQGKSRLLGFATEQDRAKAAFRTHMDGLHGAGMWNAVDAGKEQAKLSYLDTIQKQAMTNATAVAGHGAATYIASLDSEAQKFRRVLTTKGFVSQDDIILFQTAVNRLYQGQIAQATKLRNDQLQKEVSTKEFGSLPTTDIGEVTDQWMKDVTAMRDNYNSFLFGEGKETDITELSNRLKNVNSIASQINMATGTSVGNATSAIMGGGNAASRVDMLTQVLREDTILDLIYKQQGPEMQRFVPKDLLKANMVQALYNELNPFRAVDLPPVAANKLLTMWIRNVIIQKGEEEDAANATEALGNDISSESLIDQNTIYRQPTTQANMAKNKKQRDRMPTVFAKQAEIIMDGLPAKDVWYMKLEKRDGDKAPMLYFPVRSKGDMTEARDQLKSFSETINEYHAKGWGPSLEEFYADMRNQVKARMPDEALAEDSSTTPAPSTGNDELDDLIKSLPPERRKALLERLAAEK